jgi:hypothetical protein
MTGDYRRGRCVADQKERAIGKALASIAKSSCRTFGGITDRRPIGQDDRDSSHCPHLFERRLLVALFVVLANVSSLSRERIIADFRRAIGTRCNACQSMISHRVAARHRP